MSEALNENTPRVDDLDGLEVTTEQQSQLLSDLAELDNPASAQEQETQAAELAQVAEFQDDVAQMEAMAAVFAIEAALQAFVHPRVRFSDDQKQDAVKNFGAVLIKYGVLLPDWLAQYQPEMMALKSLGGLGLSAAAQVKTLRLEDHHAALAAKAGENVKAA